jgi:4-amino-4-deoxy-L-arabinose transferase-like glycosyltransferase
MAGRLQTSGMALLQACPHAGTLSSPASWPALGTGTNVASPERPRLLTPASGTTLAFILAIGATIRLVLASHAPAFTVTGQVDTVDFYSAGHNLVHSGEFQLPLKRAPLYPLFLSGIIATVGPTLETMALVQHALGLGSVVLVYLLGALAFGRGTGLLAAAGAALNGPVLLMEHTILSEALFTPLLLAGLLLLLLGLRSGRYVLFLLAGLALGLGALTRPVAQAILPLAVAAIAFQPRAWRSRLMFSCMLGVGFLLVVGPWLLRNQAVHGVPTISSGLGDSLFERVRHWDPTFDFRDQAEPIGNSQPARVRRRVFELAREHKFGSEVRSELRSEFRLTDAQSDAALREAAIQVIRQEPGRYLQGTIAMFLKLSLGFDKPLEDFFETRSKPKFAQVWPAQIRFVWESGIEPTEMDQTIVEALTSLYQDHRLGGLIAVLFLLGTARCVAARGHGGLALLPLVVLTQLLIYVAADGPLSRYRYPLQPLITLLAAGGFMLLLSQARIRVQRARWLPGATARLRGILSRPAGRQSEAGGHDGGLVARQR